MIDDILEKLKCGRPEYNEETRNYETVITKNERLAIKEITRLRKENILLELEVNAMNHRIELLLDGYAELDEITNSNDVMMMKRKVLRRALRAIVKKVADWQLSEACK